MSWLNLEPGMARNLILVHVDMLRADHLSAYGWIRETMPRTASRSWRVVDGYYAASSWTAPSAASLFSSQDLHEHGVRYYVPTSSEDGVANEVLRAPTYLEQFKSQGFAVGFFSGNEFVSQAAGFARGADRVFQHGKDQGVSNLSQLTGPALSWLDGLPLNQPFALYLHPMDVHEAYWPLPEDLGTFCTPALLPFDLSADGQTQLTQISAAYATATPARKLEITDQMSRVYDEQLLSLDRSLEALLQSLEMRGLLDETLVVLTSDHGETLNDDLEGTFSHGRTVREELVHLPLLILEPQEPAARTRCLSRNLDLGSTLLESFGLSPMQGSTGVALQDGCRAYAFASNYNLDGSLLYISVEDHDARLSWGCASGQVQTYNLTTDPGAVNDLGATGLGLNQARYADALLTFFLEIQSSLPSMTCGPSAKTPGR